MASYARFAEFCKGRHCDKGGLYAIQPVGLEGRPIKIGYARNLLQRLATWHYAYPYGIAVLAVSRMNRPNETHYGKRRTLQLAESALKRDLKRHLVAREEWMHPSAKGEILAAMRRLQLSLSPNLREHFYDFAGLGPAAAVCSARRKTVAPRCESDPACVWEPARPRGRCVPRV